MHEAKTGFYVIFAINLESTGYYPTRLMFITLDGPSGVGKSTVSKILAKQLGLTPAHFSCVTTAVMNLSRLIFVDSRDFQGLTDCRIVMSSTQIKA